MATSRQSSTSSSSRSKGSSAKATRATPAGPKKRAQKKTSSTRSGKRGKRAVTPEQAKTRAEKVLRDPKKVSQIANQAEAVADKTRAKGFKKVLGETKALIRLVRAYASGEYRSVSFESMVLIVAALIYLASPIDLVPDFMPGGLVDDAAVIAWTIALVHDELEDFMAWEESVREG